MLCLQYVILVSNKEHILSRFQNPPVWKLDLHLDVRFEIWRFQIVCIPNFVVRIIKLQSKDFKLIFQSQIYHYTQIERQEEIQIYNQSPPNEEKERQNREEKREIMQGNLWDGSSMVYDHTYTEKDRSSRHMSFYFSNPPTAYELLFLWSVAVLPVHQPIFLLDGAEQENL